MRCSSAQIPKFSQHAKVCKIPPLAFRGHTHNMGDPGTSCPVCQGDLKKMLTFARDGSQPLAPAMLILFCWPRLGEFLSCLLSPYNAVAHWPLTFSAAQTVLLQFCWIHSSPNTRDWGASSLKLAEIQPLPFLSFTAVLTMMLLHYFCYVLFIMLAQQLVRSAILL